MTVDAVLILEADMEIDELELSVRTHKALEAAGITTVEQLIKLSIFDLLKIESLGTKSIAEAGWACVELLSGNMAEQERSLLNVYEKNKAVIAAISKAKKYDRIVRVINPERME